MSIYEELKADHLSKVAPYYADLLFNMGKLDEVLVLLEAAIQANPFDTGLRFRLVEVLYKTGRHEDAQKLVQADFDLFRAGLSGMTKGELTLEDFASIRLSGSIIIFGETAAHRQKVKKVTVSNLGTKTLEISRINPPAAPFALAENTPESGQVEPGKALQLEVIFRPEAAGPYLGTWRLSATLTTRHPLRCASQDGGQNEQQAQHP